MSEQEQLMVPLNELEKATLSNACQKVLTNEGMMLLRRALFQLDAFGSRDNMKPPYSRELPLWMVDE